MGKKERKKKQEVGASGHSVRKNGSIYVQHGDIDPNLASLFAPAALPMEAEDMDYQERTAGSSKVPERNSIIGQDVHGKDNDTTLLSREETIIEEPRLVANGGEHNVPLTAVAGSAQSLKPRKRKRKEEDDDLEAVYLERLSREERSQDDELPAKRAKVSAVGRENKPSLRDVPIEDEEDSTDLPQHESQTQDMVNQEAEKSSRTVFLGNVSIEAITSKSAKKSLLRHVSSIFPGLPEHTPPHKVESIRFRSTAFSNKLPKKASFVRKELMESTMKSTNAYVVYSTRSAANAAARLLNGTVVLDRHLRVDHVAHPQKIDHKRCVFVGNLDFVDDDSGDQRTEEIQTKKKRKEPGDVEEGLWRQFGKAGTVESVRVVRDSKTRVGKGFAYVQFTDENGVEAALLFDGKAYPPLLPRKLRVSRAKKMKRSTQANRFQRPQGPNKGGFGARPMTGSQSVTSRPRKLLGKAAASQLGNIQAPQKLIFEGHRASSSQGTRGLRLSGSGKKKGKPRTRSSKRAAAWKAGGSKNP